MDAHQTSVHAEARPGAVLIDYTGIYRIDKIAITNVKGIESSVFDVQLIPNKPTLVVAPNGFGKSS
ncbi:hypothetical protein, partial [Pseudomonas aeruginosa]|uniref:hypothetical protein n=1 Tax=Pseudomonas aeruginosa TaxID=287 RepID=UPI003CF9EC4C